ncbi:DNA topoisomerase 3 (plasmid) [Yersinia pseudotuberculosis IP 32953]|uniref:DNA topoisomerase n=1 Tax=Yersinia pseudotuberculosis serotype I (strain IP32953) TaxID=273123 RepID=Q663C4_YERPS|nr:type IA DNA topoisomerase [Yersinia pseudotuberculosis]AJJ53071.1 DNA topoisomerase 3 [Yersinia pseudotuberculosis IP 32953]CAF25473.1 DNA topoisomerase III family [Yersinia pseudotuberculosis IP 32953]
MRVFIAEKPALAKVIADALGAGVRKDGYIQCGSDVVTWCVGHILELSPPEAHNPAYAKWNAADLPLKLRPAKYQPKTTTAAQFKVVQQLVGQATEIVHAGDPDDEGQLLVDEVLTYCDNTSPVKRVLINDLNTAAAKKALANLRDNREFLGLSQKALARSIGDQLYGFNMTRAYTLAAQQKGVQGVLSVGRVQTPILGLIVNRFNTFQNHSAAFFYNLSANIDVIGHRIVPRYQVPEGAPVDDKGRLIDETVANDVATACKGQPATVTASQTEEKSTPAPLPFSLLDLQAHMSKKHGLSAQQTQDVTQSLRENHKAITYNRSDCNYLTSEQFGDACATLAAIASALPVLAVSLSEANPAQKGRAFDDKKVSAHTAIIPTTTAPNPASMTVNERQVYHAIAAQYLAQFLPEKRYLAASATFAVNGHIFIAKATQTTQDGWTTLLSGTEDNEGESNDEFETSPFAALSALSNSDEGVCESVTVSKEKTKPLPLYTEATLLKDLQRVAKYVKDPKIRQLLKDRDAGKTGEHGGIGTPATRASMLETLQKRGFYTVEKKKLIPTELGLSFIASLPEIATAPDMTALWHEQQQMIEQGSFTVDEFLDALEDFIAGQMNNVDLSGMADGVPQTQSSQRPRLTAVCPKCNGAVVISAKVYACSGCELKVWGEVASKKLTLPQVETLFSKGKTAVLKGFKSKAGKPFDAKLVLDTATGKVSFEFENKK